MMKRDFLHEIAPKAKAMRRKERRRGIMLIPQKTMNLFRRRQEKIVQEKRNMYCPTSLKDSPHKVKLGIIISIL